MVAQSLPNVQAVGVNSIDGYYLLTEDDEKVAISRDQYFQIRFDMAMAEADEPEPDYDDLADYLAGMRLGISMF